MKAEGLAMRLQKMRLQQYPELNIDDLVNDDEVYELSYSEASMWCPYSGFTQLDDAFDFERRLRLGGPLLKENIATMVLERQRRPFLQSGSKLLCVSNLLLLGRATIEEGRCLLHCMGGVHATMVGSLHRTPVATFSFFLHTRLLWKVY